ncbi:MAG: glycosyltransferase family 9 protein [bacterium]
MDIDKSSVKNILIIKVSALGDIIRSFPALVSVAKTFPEAKISFMIGEQYKELLEPCPYVSEIIPYRKRKNTEDLMGFIRFALEMRSRQFDMVLNLQNTNRFDILTKLSGAKYKSEVITLERPMNGVEGVFEVLRTAGLRPKKRYYELWMTDADRSFAESFLARNGIAATDKIIGLNPAAGWESKQWPVIHYADLAAKLISADGAKIIVFGSGEERGRAEEIQRLAGSPITIASGETTIRQAFALIRLCSAFVSNDSGLMHAAALQDVPTAAIFGSTNPAYHGPAGDGHLTFFRGVDCSPCSKSVCEMDFEQYYCLTAIPASEVYKGVRRIMR